MSKYEFSVILTGDVLTFDDCDRLYEAGCDDGTIVTRSGVHFIGFDREADSLEEAIRSAIANVQKAGFQVAKVELEPEALATT